jgi:hypothetical protein
MVKYSLMTHEQSSIYTSTDERDVTDTPPIKVAKATLDIVQQGDQPLEDAAEAKNEQAGEQLLDVRTVRRAVVMERVRRDFRERPRRITRL